VAALTTPLVVAQGQDPVGQVQWRVGFPVGVGQMAIVSHGHVAAALAARVFGVAFVEAAHTQRRSRTEWVHVRGGLKVGRACHGGGGWRTNVLCDGHGLAGQSRRETGAGGDDDDDDDEGEGGHWRG